MIEMIGNIFCCIGFTMIYLFMHIVTFSNGDPEISFNL